MKWLFCEMCGSGFTLGYELKSCDCGSAKGKYINQSEAVTNGKGVCVAIGNGSFFNAMDRVNATKPNEYNREEYQHIGKIEYAWVRPHEGSGNPHCTVHPELGAEE